MLRNLKYSVKSDAEVPGGAVTVAVNSCALFRDKKKEINLPACLSAGLHRVHHKVSDWGDSDSVIP